MCFKKTQYNTDRSGPEKNLMTQMRKYLILAGLLQNRL